MHDEGQIPVNRDTGSDIPDATVHNWVDRFAPGWSRPFLRLSRADRPIGTWLLLIPCWWGLMMAMASDPGSVGIEDLWIFAGCAFGAAVMRGAGCTWNDVVDRDLDSMVERTRNRPLASGRISPFHACIWMVIQSLAGLAILVTFNSTAILLGLASLVPVAVYPFAKRFTWWPQIFLGIAFNWGVLLAWAAHDSTPGPAMLLLYLSGICWTLFYDTIYAHLDREDDDLVGIRSTARLFGDNSRAWLLRFVAASAGLMMVAVAVAIPPGTHAAAFVISSAGVLCFALHLLLQLRRLDLKDSSSCLRIFRSNRDAGLIPVTFLAIAVLVG